MMGLPRNIAMLHGRGMLSDQQILAAVKFIRDPTAFPLPPTLFRILRETLIEDRPLEALESKRGWAARSAKVVLSVLLYALQETEGFAPLAQDERDGLSRLEEDEPDGLSRLKEEIAWLKGEDATTQAELMLSWGLTSAEARLLLVLRARLGKCVTYDTIIRAMDWDHHDAPVRNLQVYLSKIRRKTKAAPFRVETVRGVGCKYIEETQDVEPV